jgi:hypothetical protein
MTFFLEFTISTIRTLELVRTVPVSMPLPETRSKTMTLKLRLWISNACMETETRRLLD